MADSRTDRDDDEGSELDDREDDLDRLDRFGETEENPELLRSQSKHLKPFYNGSVLDDRNAEMRKSIYYIRQHWDEFDSFMTSLQQLLMEGGAIEFKNETTRKHAEKLFSSKRNWMTEESVMGDDVSFDAIKLYTSKEGHSRIYQKCNDIFRQEDSVLREHMIRSVVFLIELINIDLYNYCLKYPEKRDFQGMVYRGMCLSDEDLMTFKSLRDQPINRRNIAVPLVMFSASSSITVAKKFIKHRMEEQRRADKRVNPLLFKINIIGLKPEYFKHLRFRFPEMTLTSTGAVDIHQLSRHPSEMEVLMRGGLYTLILDVFEDENEIEGHVCSVLEAVMVNSNRDHITTSVVGDIDNLSRDMYAAMVTVTRSEFAVKYYHEKGMKGEELEYKQVLEESRSKVESFMKL